MELKKKTEQEKSVNEEKKIEAEEIAFEDLRKITGAGSEWDDVPPIDEHPYDPETIKKT